MCRFLGIIVDQRTNFSLCLREAPRSMAGLSREHPDGWGVALYSREGDWTLHKSLTRADEDALFAEQTHG